MVQDLVCMVQEKDDRAIIGNFFIDKMILHVPLTSDFLSIVQSYNRAMEK